MTAFNWVELTNVVGKSSAPIPGCISENCTTELAVNPVPFTVSITSGLPSKTVSGLMVLMLAGARRDSSSSTRGR